MPRPRESRWYQSPRLWVELFALLNLAFLGPDIYLAHSTNSFRHRAEYMPLYFSLAAPGVLLVGHLALWAWSATGLWRFAGYLVGGTAVAVGVAGLLWHLGSRFFVERTLESLVYTAPFAAPLAYTGIGLLLIMNRTVDADSPEWAYWVLLLALGGFVGNFIFSLADHAQNAFFHEAEWLPVASSAFAIGFLLVPFLVRVTPAFLAVCAGVMALQAVVGLLGAYYHTAANLEGPSPSQFDNIIYGAPPLAPLLFPNLALLALLGLWRLWGTTAPAAAAEPAPAAETPVC
jgi:hypothetical protein